MHFTNKFIPQTQDTRDFHIVEEFAALEANRKMLLCDNLFCDGPDTFEKAVNLIWPQANKGDMKKLEKFLILLKRTSH